MEAWRKFAPRVASRFVAASYCLQYGQVSYSWGSAAHGLLINAPNFPQ